MTQDKQNPPVFQLFTVSEAADALHLHLSTLRRLIRAGDLPVVRIGGAIRIDPEELRRFIGLEGHVAATERLEGVKARASSGTCPHRQGSCALWPHLGHLHGRPGGLPSHASPAGA